MFCGSAVLEVSSKQESKRRFKMFKIFGVNFLKTRNFGMARVVLKKDQMFSKAMVPVNLFDPYQGSI